MLRAFIYERMSDKFKSCIESGFKWLKNKGKLQEAINGEYNLITLVHNVAKKDILLPTKAVTAEDNVDTAATLSLEEPSVNEVGACI